MSKIYIIFRETLINLTFGGGSREQGGQGDVPRRSLESPFLTDVHDLDLSGATSSDRRRALRVSRRRRRGEGEAAGNQLHFLFRKKIGRGVVAICLAFFLFRASIGFFFRLPELLSICNLSINLAHYQSTNLSIHLPINLSINQSTNLSITLSIHPSISLSIYTFHYNIIKQQDETGSPPKRNYETMLLSSSLSSEEKIHEGQTSLHARRLSIFVSSRVSSLFPFLLPRTKPVEHFTRQCPRLLFLSTNHCVILLLLSSPLSFPF